MHGMICKALEAYIQTTHGQDLWVRVLADADLGHPGFETMLTYPDAEFIAVLRAASAALSRQDDAILEDMGAWVVTHPPLAPVRLLFRFSGATFYDFLMSIDDIDARARLKELAAIIAATGLATYTSQLPQLAGYSLHHKGIVGGAAVMTASQLIGETAIQYYGRGATAEDGSAEEIVVAA